VTPVIYLDASLPICSSGLSTAQARALVAFYGDFFRKSHLLAAGRVYHRWQSPDSVVSSYLTLFTFTASAQHWQV